MSNKNQMLKKLKEKFSDCKGNRFIYPQYKLFEETWLFNSKSNLLQQAEELNVPENLRMIFYSLTNYRIVERFYDALMYWDSIDGINGTGGYIACLIDTVVCVDENGNSIYKIATAEDIRVVMESQQKVFNKLGLEHGRHSVVKYRLWNEYNKLLKEELSNRGSNIKYHFKTYDFTFRLE